MITIGPTKVNIAKEIKYMRMADVVNQLIFLGFNPTVKHLDKLFDSMLNLTIDQIDELIETYENQVRAVAQHRASPLA